MFDETDRMVRLENGGPILPRRIFVLANLWLLCLLILLLRLFVLMVIPAGAHRDGGMSNWLSQTRSRAELEHFALIRTDDARGRILYRNGAPWSGTHRVAVFRSSREKVPVEVHSEMQPGRSFDPVVGFVGLPDVWPDAGRIVAEQGRSGLEYRFDKSLRGGRPGYAGVIRDVHGKPYGKMFYEIEPIAGDDLRTTIHPSWQQVSDTLLTQAQVRLGAVVVLDVKTNQILALANRDINNRTAIPALLPFAPGSVFKLVTAAAGLESYRYRGGSTFVCTGRVLRPGIQMACWRVHGLETLTQALAASCDVAYAEIGAVIGQTGMEEMARRLHIAEVGLQTISGRAVLSEALPGKVYVGPAHDAGTLANTAIGQESVRISPLAAANLASTIARGGIYQEAQLIINRERQGQVIEEYRSGRGERVVASGTAAVLGQAMRLAVTSPDGTAHVLDAEGELAAKTGTAELSDSRVNHWLIGYFPYHHPKIAISVAVLDAPSTFAHHATWQIVRGLCVAYKQIRQP